LKDCGDDAGKRLMTRSSNHSICLQQRLVWTWWLASGWTLALSIGSGGHEFARIKMGYPDLIVVAAMQKACRVKFNECVLSPEKRV
jgi:hypothetical protein